MGQKSYICFSTQNFRSSTNQSAERSVCISFEQRLLFPFSPLAHTELRLPVFAGLIMRGKLHLSTLESALNDVVARHAVLTLAYTADGRPLDKPASTGLRIIPITPAEMAKRIRRAETTGIGPPDVESTGGAGIRAELYTDAMTHMLELTFDRLGFDAQSIYPFARDLCHSYRARISGKDPHWAELEFGYDTYASRQREMIRSGLVTGGRMFDALTFWEQALKDLAVPRNLPTDESWRPAASGSSIRRLEFRLDSKIHQQIVSIARTSGASVFMLVHTALLILLALFDDNKDIAIGAILSGRGGAPVPRMIGRFENIVVLRVNADGDPSYRELINRVRMSDLSAYQNRHVPFALISERLNHSFRSARRLPFQIALSLRRAREYPFDLPGIRTALCPIEPRRADCEIFFDLFERRGADGSPQGIEGWVEFRSDLMSYRRVESMLATLGEVILSAVSKPDGRISELAGGTNYGWPETNPRRSVPRFVERYSPPSSSLQHRLVLMFQQLLGVKRVSMRDDFFHLGGTSELGCELLSSIREAYGITLPLSMLQPGLTPEFLGDALISRVANAPLIEITPGDPRRMPPLFFLHGDFEGGGLYAWELANMLGPEQPFFILQQHGFSGGAIPSSIEEMAADHARRLRFCFPERPCVLAGFCNGALIAFELARQLCGDGKCIPLVIMIDPPYREGKNRMPNSAHLSNRTPPPKFTDPRARSSWLFGQYIAPIHCYKPGGYAGRVALICNSGKYAPRLAAQGRHWAEPVRNLECYSVRGDHVTCIGLYLDDLAVRFRSLLMTVASADQNG